MQLGNRMAVVTGAGSGIGRAIALEMAARGAAVAVVDLSHERATDTVALPLPYLLRRGLFALGLLGLLERGPMRWCFPRFGRSIIAVCRASD